MNNRPKTTVVLAMTADGKIADRQSSPARFGSANDKIHLEQQVSLADAVIFGAGTLRAYGTTLSVRNTKLLQARLGRSQSPQPIQIVVSASGKINSQLPFFQQPVPRWLITTELGAESWQGKSQFDKILIGKKNNNLQIDWIEILNRLRKLGLDRLAILGGSQLVASLLEMNLIDELWLTVCPVIFGGSNAPTPVGGIGFNQFEAKKLKLLEVKQIDAEIFLHYAVNN
jgi:5-amino-6-(5-phosphoribosylamino)uracil reductase